MELLEGLKTRRSVRRYTDELISHELFEEIIDTAKMAPTWKNTQTLRYILIQNEEIIKKICDDCLLGFEHNAKTLSKCKNLVVLTQVNGRCGYEKDGSFSTSKGTGWEMFDAGIAAMTFSLPVLTYGRYKLQNTDLFFLLLSTTYMRAPNPVFQTTVFHPASPIGYSLFVT